MKIVIVEGNLGGFSLQKLCEYTGTGNIDKEEVGREKNLVYFGSALLSLSYTHTHPFFDWF